MISGFFQGFAFLFQGFPMIFQKGIRGFVLIPLLINIVVFSGAVWLAYTQYQQLMARVLGLVAILVVVGRVVAAAVLCAPDYVGYLLHL